MSTLYVLCVRASVFIATKQWCKNKMRFCPYKRECLDTALFGWNFQIKDHQITYLMWKSLRSVSGKTVQDVYRVLVTGVLSGDYIAKDHSEGRLESEYAFNGSCQDDHGSTSDVERERSTLAHPLARSL